MLLRMATFWRPARGDTVAGAALLVVAAGVELLHPWPIKGLVDYVLGSQPAPLWLQSLWPAFAERDATGMVTAVCLAIVLIAVTHKLLHLGSQYLLIRAGNRVVRELRCRACDHVHRLGLTYHDRTKVGESLYRIAYDTQAAQSLICQGLAPVATGVLVLIGVVAIMLQLDLVLTLVAVAIAPVFWITIRKFGVHIERRSRRYHENESALVSTLQESLSSIRAVQAFSREPEATGRVGEQAGESVRASQRLVLVQLAFGASVGVAMALGTAAVVGIGAHRVLGGHLTVGDVLVFLGYLAMLYQPINAFTQSAGVFHAAKSQLDRVFAVLDTAPEIRDRPGALAPAAVEGSIAFEDVSFAYEADRTVLHHVDLEVEPGQVVALVGETGAGKTTLASLLLRFYDPSSGRVLLDGRDLRDLQLTWLRRQVSVVLQDSILFSSTVAENILYARPAASRAEVEAAARHAQADGFIRELPDGYDTLLGERGVDLSGGQRQRIAIARAFLKDAPVLVLDEPTSALDANTERALTDTLGALFRGRTTFIIAHRLSTVRLADLIVVLHGGHIVERGSHAELLGSDTLYRRLHRAQQGGADDTGGARPRASRTGSSTER